MDEVTPHEAQVLLANEGTIFIDVRSQPEFQAGHVPLAYNVPIAFACEGGFEDNPVFIGVVERHFSKRLPIVVGCKSGGRSGRAALLLREAGYTVVFDMPAGFEGKRDAFGSLVTKGWSRCDLPVENGKGSDRSYESLTLDCAHNPTLPA